MPSPYYAIDYNITIDEALKRCLQLNIEVETELNLLSNEFLNDFSKSDVLKDICSGAQTIRWRQL